MERYLVDNTYIEQNAYSESYYWPLTNLNKNVN